MSCLYLNETFATFCWKQMNFTALYVCVSGEGSVLTQYLCREQPSVHSVLWAPVVALTPVEVELTKPVFVL